MTDGDNQNDNPFKDKNQLPDDINPFIKLDIEQGRMTLDEYQQLQNYHNLRWATQAVESGKMTKQEAEAFYNVKFPPGIDDKYQQSIKNNFFMPIGSIHNGIRIRRPRPDTFSMSNYLIEKHGLVCIDGYTYIYDNNYYQQITKDELENIINVLSGSLCSSHEITEFYRLAKIQAVVDKDNLKSTNGFINLNNGILNVSELKLMPHSRDYFFKYKLPHNFNKYDTCPNWNKFLENIFEGDYELIKLVQEVFGYCLQGGTPWLHKAFMFYGSGRNGKSTVLDVLKRLLGKENFSTVPIENLNKPFSAVMTDGKLANIVGEIPYKQISSEVFKSCASGEEIIAAHKNQPEYSMPFTARIVFAGNKLPNLGDSTVGGNERLCIIPFKNYIKQIDRIPNYAERFLFPEISGILNWALNGLNRLIHDKQLIKAKAVDELFKDYRRESDSVFDWCEENLIFDAKFNNEYYVKNFYQLYRDKCQKEGRLPLSLIGYSRQVIQYVKEFNEKCAQKATQVEDAPQPILISSSYPIRILGNLSLRDKLMI